MAAARSAAAALGDGRTPTGVLDACEGEGEGGRATGADAGQEVDGDVGRWPTETKLAVAAAWQGDAEPGRSTTTRNPKLDSDTNQFNKP